jgi:hypothetical protein
MKRFFTLALVSGLVLGVGSVAYANICAFDPVPAATLLFPLLVYNYDAGELSDDSLNTLFAITNVSSDAQIVHVTLWTDYSVSVLDWNVVLTGYDVYTFNARDVLRDGKIPPTYVVTHALDGDGNFEGAIDQGPVSGASHITPVISPPQIAQPESTIVFDGVGTDPFPCDPALNEAYPGRFQDPTEDNGGIIPTNVLDFFEVLLRGSQTVNDGFNDCVSPTLDFNLGQANWWDDRASADDTWGYITADVVNVCNKAFPDESAYWQGMVENTNVLIGDVAWVDEEANFSEVQNAVHVEADDRIDFVVTAIDQDEGTFPTTFYSRYSNAEDTTDWREPLPTAWGFRYQDADLPDGSSLDTMIRTWKAQSRTDAPNDIIWDLRATVLSNGVASELVSRNCLAYTYYVWDEEENVDIVVVERPPWSGGPTTPIGVVPNFLPLETQEVNADHFNLLGPFGWLMFIWPASNMAVDPQFDEELRYQTWMGVKYAKTEVDNPSGPGFSGAKDGAVLANYNCFDQQTLPGLGINFRYIEITNGGQYTRSRNTASE